jgi:putative DNA primase/helicase
MMDLPDIKAMIETYREAGRSREETVEMVASLDINGDRSSAFEYCDLIYKRPTDQGQGLKFTDAENAEYFVEMFAERLRYDHRRSRWLEWAGHHWREDNDGQVTRLALKAMRERYHNAVKIDDPDKRKDIAKKAVNSEQRARLEAVIGLARDFKPVANAGDGWDPAPWLFGVSNGVVELKTGNFRDGRPDDRITQHSPVKYDPAFKALRWLAFQDEITGGNTELVRWKQKFYGYCLTGITNEQCIAINYGTGANGKGREAAALRYVFGDYAYDAPFSTFELANRSAIPNDLAALVGKRLVTSSETNEGTRLNEARIKALSGEDPVTARFLHCEFFTFQPVGKFVLAVNHRPRVHDDSYGFWRRVRLIPFTHEFKGKAEDKELLIKLIAEAPGILNWLIEGCLAWQSEGLTPTPECVLVATREYEADSDPLSEFILDACVINTQAYVQSSKLYKAYLSWCDDQGYREKERMTNNAFGRRMGQKFKKSHKEVGAVYIGLAIKADGFLTDSIAMFTENKVNSTLDTRMGNKHENPSETVIPSSDPTDAGPDPQGEDDADLPTFK